MHTILVIFRKDVQRLWWQVAVTLVLLGVLAHQDSWRADMTPDALEGWLNLLVPLAWGCLVAQSIYGEALVGDREFWMTRPYRWPQLLAAKVVFAVVFVHVPALIADLWIVGARGLSPVAAMPHLLAKQLLLAGAVTLPSAALASVSSNLMQFVFVAVLAPVVVMALRGNERFGFMWPNNHRSDVAIAILAAISVVTLFLQFGGRRTRWSRTVGAMGGVAAALFLLLMPSSVTMTLNAATRPAHVPVSIRLDPEGATPFYRPASGTVAIVLPVAATGLPTSHAFRSYSLAIQADGANGARYRRQTAEVVRGFAPIDFAGGISLLDARWMRQFRSAGRGGPTSNAVTPPFVNMTMSPDVWGRLRATPVTVSGRALLQFLEFEPEVRFDAPGSANVPGLGRCSSILQEVQFRSMMLKVVCESVYGAPPSAAVTLRQKGSDRVWFGRLGDAQADVSGPRSAWWSPIERVQTAFHFTEGDSTSPGAQWLVPMSAIGNLEVVVSPERTLGYETVDYRLPSVDLNRYVRKP